MRATPEHISHLEPHQIMVFGSNRGGRHGRGAARTAYLKFGAKMGQGTGLMGQSYGIATKGRRLEILPLRDIAVQVHAFLRFAAKHPELEFLMTKIGCGLAGYSTKEIKKCFEGQVIPPNVILPIEFQ